MYTHKYYSMVVGAKEFVDTVINEGADPLYESRTGKMSHTLRSREYCSSINTRAAVAAVLTSGTFLESGQFMTPSTKLCLMNFKYARRQLSDNRPIKVSVADGNHDIYTVKF